MYLRARAIHLVSLFAILVSMFSGVLNQPVQAQEPPEQATPVSRTPVVPVMPAISEATCGEGVAFAQVATPVQTEGISYTIGQPDEVGVFTVTATLTDSSLYTWADTGLDGWTVNGDVATSTGTLALCPVPEPGDDASSPGDSGEEGDTGNSDGAAHGDEDGKDSGVATPDAGSTAARMGPTNTDAPLLRYRATANKSTAKYGDEVIFTITVENIGTADSGPYEFSTELARGGNVFANKSPMEYTAPDGMVCYDHDVIPMFNCYNYGSPVTLPAGETHVFRVTATVIATTCVEEMTRGGGKIDQTLWEAGSYHLGSPFETVLVSVNCDSQLSIDVTTNLTETDPVIPGKPIAFTITVANSGSDPADDYQFQFGTSQGALTNFGPSQYEPNRTCDSPSAGQFICGLMGEGSLAAGSSDIYVFTGDVPAATTELCENGIRLLTTPLGTIWGADPEPIEIHIPVNCTLLNLTATDSIAPGESVGLHEPFTYTVTVTNTGSGTDGAFQILSQLPPGVILTGDSPITHPAGTTCIPNQVGSLAPVTINCSGTSVPSGEGNGLVFEFTVMAVDIFDNQLTLTSCDEVMFAAAGILGVWNDNARLVNVYTDLDCVSSVDYTLEPLETPVELGGTIGYVQTVRNTGNTHIITLGMFDAPPPGLPAGAEWSGSFEIDGVTYDSLPSIGALKPGSVFKATYQSSPIPTDLTLPAPEWCTQFTFNNDVEFMFTTQERVEDSGSATVSVNCTDLSIEQQVSEASIAPGGQVTYTINVINIGNTTVSPLYVFHDSSETGGVFSNWQIISENAMDCGLVEDVHPGCTYLTLDPEETVEITITGDAPLDPTAQQCEPVTSRAVFIYGEALSPAQLVANSALPYTPVYSEPVTTQLNCEPGFTFTNEPLESPVVPGESIGFELTIHNDGTVRMDNVSFDNVVLPDLPAGNWNVTTTLNGEPVDPLNFIGLDPGETLVVTVMSDPIPGDLTVPNNEWCKPWSSTFSAVAEFSEGSEQTITDSATVQVNCTGFSIDMDVSAPIIEAGGEVTYTITVTNNSTHEIYALAVFGEMSEASNVFSNWSPFSEDAGTCGFTNVDNLPHQGCVFYDVAPGQTVQVEITGDAPEVPALNQCAPVMVTPVGAYNSVAGANEIRFTGESVSTQIDCQPDVDISLDSEIDTGDNDRVDAGDTITYTMAVTNTGNMALYDLAVSTEMAGVDWDDELTIDELLPRNSVTLTGTYTITQEDIDAGEIVSTASVDASLEPQEDEDDPAPVTLLGFAQVQVDATTISASVTETTQLVQEPDIDLTMSSDEEDDLSLGDTVIYSFTITNTGNVILSGLELISELEGLEISAVSAIGDLAPGESAEGSATYIVSQADVDAGEVENCVEVTALAPDQGTITAEACVTDAVAPNPQPEPSPTPTVPATPEPTASPTQPATPDAEETPTQVVSKLPETGSGGVDTITPILWIAAVLGSVVMGIGGLGLRKRT